MPRPVYIIPAQIVSEDKTTNLVSIVSVLEKVELRVVAAKIDNDEEKHHTAGGNQGRLESNILNVMAVWMREDGDSGRVFEHEFVIRMPGVEGRCPGPQPFEFDPRLPFRRFKWEVRGLPPLAESCIVEIESRIRERDHGEWVVQSYPLVYEVVGEDKIAPSQQEHAVHETE